MKTFSRLLVSLIFLGALCTNCMTVQAQSSSKFSKELYTNSQGDTLLYRLLFPDYNLSRKYPLVIFLHGSGERGTDNEAQLKWGVQNFATDQAMSLHPALVVAPQCPANQGWANFDEQLKTGSGKLLPAPSKPAELVIELIRKLIRTLPVDTNRIYITGLSMGGFGTFDIISRYPKLFAAAIPVCGGGDSSMAKTIASIPMWIVHGSEDPGVPASLSLDMLNAIVKAGGKPGCTFYPEMGHFSWLAAYSDPLMMEWLFRQHK